MGFCRTKQNSIWLQHRKSGITVEPSRRFYKYFQFSGNLGVAGLVGLWQVYTFAPHLSPCRHHFSCLNKSLLF